MRRWCGGRYYIAQGFGGDFLCELVHLVAKGGGIPRGSAVGVRGEGGRVGVGADAPTTHAFVGYSCFVGVIGREKGASTILLGDVSVGGGGEVVEEL